VYRVLAPGDAGRVTANRHWQRLRLNDLRLAVRDLDDPQDQCLDLERDRVAVVDRAGELVRCVQKARLHAAAVGRDPSPFSTCTTKFDITRTSLGRVRGPQMLTMRATLMRSLRWCQYSKDSVSA
jgi:hypothetical protein